MTTYDLASQASLNALATRLAALEAKVSLLQVFPGSGGGGTPIGIGLSRCLARSYTAPVYPTPLRTFYIDALNGNDANTVAQAQDPNTPWRTINKFNTNATPGDRGYFQGLFGGSSSNFILPAVSGAAGAKIVYELWPGRSANFHLGFNGLCVSLVNRSHIVLKNLDLSGSAEHPIVNARSTTGGFGSNWIQGCTIDPLTEGLAGDGVDVGLQTDFRLEDCILRNIGARSSNSGDAWFVSNGSHRFVAVRNQVSQCGHSGGTIGYQTAGEPTSDDCVVAQNFIRNAWAGGLIFNGKTNRVLCECNDIADAATTAGGFVPGTRDNLLILGTGGIYRYNRIWNALRRPISCETYVNAGFTQLCLNNLIHNNTLWDSGGAAIGMSDSVAGMAGNLVFNNLGWNTGLNWNAVEGTPGSQPNGVAIYCVQSPLNDPWPRDTLGGNVFKNNRFSRNGGFTAWAQVLDAARISYTISQWNLLGTNVGNNDNGDPSFVSPIEPSPDLRLAAVSNAIDQGLILPGWLPGIDYLGAAPDLGAYEIQ